jgi:EAL domain-containing protein (putative c-di-GMP-specific phosphodiesterase class I)/CheY-like chemotaxis protein
MNVEPIRIMVVDDDQFMCRVLARTLRELGFSQVVVVHGAATALQRLEPRQADIDLILLDINMPEMDGVQFIRELVKRHYGGSVILVSGESSRTLQSVECLLGSLDLTSLGRLQKPVSRKALRELLAHARPNIGCVRRNGSTGRSYSIHELRSALRHQQFVNFYQPMISLVSGEVVGMECLLRWRHPTEGLVYPAQFIPVAETYGLIGDLTRDTLKRAVQDVTAWCRAGYCIPAAVNVTMDELMALDFPDWLSGALEGVAAGLVSLEVTEGGAMRDLSTVLDVLSRLRLRRIRVAIDDFGTGQASLAHLRDLPFDDLKVDGSFVHGAASNATLRSMCKASLKMARQLRMRAVAEGIEQVEDWEFARHVGFDMGQGYFIAPPLPLASVHDWLGSRAAGRGATGAGGGGVFWRAGSG